VAAVGLIDRRTNAFLPYASTSAFNLQQGSMMHWIDAGYGQEFTYNDFESQMLVSRVVNLHTREVRTIEGAIAAVSPTEPLALGLNYARMAHCRPVVGYANPIDPASLVAAPEDDGLSLIDLRSGTARLILSLAEVIGASGVDEVQGKRAWFNHVLFNTDGTKILFFCRVNPSADSIGRFYSSLWTVNVDGSDLACQIPFMNRISHFAWRDERRVLISTDFLGEMGFLEFIDGAGDFAPVGAGILPPDGHACFSPDRHWIVCDARLPRQGDDLLTELLLYDRRNEVVVSLGTYRADAQFVGDIRCDLHPRWSPDGQCVTFDSVHEGARQIYLVDVSDIVKEGI
jgi:hypothetical protein